MSNDSVNVMLVTREFADHALSRNQNYRRISNSHLHRLMGDLRNGRWVYNGASIIFDRAGNLIDGQHRLEAVRRTGIPIKAVVVRDVDSDASLSIDTGAKRTYAQYLAFKGEKNANKLGAALRWISAFDTVDGTEREAMSVVNMMTHADCDKALVRHPSVRHWVAAAGRLSKLTSAAHIAVVCTLGTAIEDDDPDELKESFIAGINTGAGMSDGDPRYLLRERLLKDAVAKVSMRAHQKLAYATIAWNYYREGRSTTSQGLRYREVGPMRQKFPTPL